MTLLARFRLAARPVLATLPPAVVLAAAWLVGGCAPSAGGFHPYVAPAPPPMTAAMADVARVRGLPLDAPVPIEALDDASFQRASRAHQQRASADQTAELDLFAQSFTLGTAGSLTTGARNFYDAELEGFYEPSTKHLFLRGGAGTTTRLARAVFEHEVEHALQDQEFGFPAFANLPFDAALAQHALYEGDATLVAAVLEGERDGLPAAVTIAALTRLEESALRDPLASARAAKVEQAPPVIREAIGWPYVGGTAFVAQLASAGGFALVDDVFSHPPQTTEQVLHVEKYLAGEQAVPVSVPASPNGYRRGAGGTMGELLTRVFLAQCSSDADARAAAAGWGGDAFAAVTKEKETGLLWVSAWDDALAAARFARALEARRKCARTGQKPALTVVREGSRVAFVQGLDGEEERQNEAARMFALVGDPAAPRPPLATIPSAARLHPPVPSEFAARGTVTDGWFVDDAIGVRAPVMGMSVTHTPLVDLVATLGPAKIVLATLWAPPSDTLEATSVLGLSEAMGRVRRVDKMQLFEGEPSAMNVAWGTARVRELRVADRQRERVVLAPLCDGKMTLLVVARWPADSGSEPAVDGWINALRATPSSPACEALKTLEKPVGPK